MESVELKHFNRGTSGDTEIDEESALCPLSKNKNTNKEKDKDQNKEKERPKDKDNKDQVEDDGGQRPWHALVSYVDEITLGGRKNSKGQYVDGMGSFPGFGKKKKPKVPPDCFPPGCYDRYFLLLLCCMP